MTRDRRAFRAMLAALAVDNAGSGLFLPITLVYLTRVVGLTLAQASLALTVGTIAGTAMPALAARVVDRLGGRTVVCLSQLLQALGMLAYLGSHGLPLAVTAAVLTAAGTQLFYAALGTMTSDLAGDQQDDAFAQVARWRGLAFGLGALGGGLLLSASGGWLRAGIALNALSLLAAALLLAMLVPAAHRAHGPAAAGGTWVLRDRRFVVLLATTFLLMVGVELFLLATPVYAHERLGVAGWVVGSTVTLLTFVGAVFATRAVAWTAHLSRTDCLRVGSVLTIAWALGTACLAALPHAWRAPALLVCTLVYCAGNLVIGPRLPALVTQVSPPERKGAYFAYFQYAFTAAQLVAPSITALMAWQLVAPWLVDALLVAVAAVLAARLGRTLDAVR